MSSGVSHLPPNGSTASLFIEPFMNRLRFRFIFTNVIHFINFAGQYSRHSTYQQTRVFGSTTSYHVQLFCQLSKHTSIHLTISR